MNRIGKKPNLYVGSPVRETMLPYGRQSLDEDDIAAVVEGIGLKLPDDRAEEGTR